MGAVAFRYEPELLESCPQFFPRGELRRDLVAKAPPHDQPPLGIVEVVRQERIPTCEHLLELLLAGLQVLIDGIDLLLGRTTGILGGQPSIDYPKSEVGEVIDQCLDRQDRLPLPRIDLIRID